MTPERYQKAKEIFHAALDRAPGERSAFLASACGGDELLRKEVESLISSHEKDGTFIDSPAYEAAAELLANDQELKAGQKVGSYEVISFISRGGMGEVYLAQDRRLGRKVALKLLSASFTRDADRLGRFEQEARAASALNHPNIITIYEILKANAAHVIATEFVEGETLRQRLAHTPLNLTQSLHVAIQIADALVAAHQAGIVHRDIKPENVMLRPDGYVKVLDFGLAKLAGASPSEVAAEAPTQQVRTGSGMVMGTAGYMSPEQARGKPVDVRSDIFSLGAVIYEMVTQRKPFDGETPSDILVAILKTDPPPVSQFVDEAPAELVRIVSKTLRKDRDERYQTAKELLSDMRGLKQRLEFQSELGRRQSAKGDEYTSPAQSEATFATSPKTPVGTDAVSLAHSTKPGSLTGKSRLTIALASVVLVAGILSFASYKLFRNRQSTTAIQADHALPDLKPAQVTAWSGLDTYPSFSPDGNSVAYSSDHNGAFEIYVKQMATGGREIQLTTDGQNFEPAWSPDGKLIAYQSRMRGGIWLVPAFGGATRQLTDFGSRPAWSPDSAVIAFQSGVVRDSGPTAVALPPSTIWTVPAQGGSPKQITQTGNPVGGHSSPSWFPGGKRIVFSSSTGSRSEIWSTSPAGDESRRLLERAGFDPVYAPNGESLYFTGGDKLGDSWALFRLPVSPQSGDPVGEPVLIKHTGDTLYRHLRISADGKRIVFAVLQLDDSITAVPVAPHSGEATGRPVVLTPDTSYRRYHQTFSPDGQKIAYILVQIGSPHHMWVMDADGGNQTQVTTEPNATNFSPNWFPGGDRIAFQSNRQGQRMMRAIDLKSSRDELLFTINQDMGWPKLSPDGKQFAFNSAKNGPINIWTIPAAGGEAKQLTFDQELAGFPTWSPDGRFIALQLGRGQDSHIAIMPSGGGSPVQLTSDHGQTYSGSWSPDGSKITFAGERNGVWNIWWVSVKDKSEKKLTNYTKINAYVRYPAWSPLDNQIIYEYAETRGNIWLMELK